MQNDKYRTGYVERVQRLISRNDIYAKHAGNWFQAKEPLTTEIIEKAFSGEVTIGTYCEGPRGCNWVAFDLDNHNNDEAKANANFKIAKEIADVCEHYLLNPLIEDSDGVGGYHIWISWISPISPLDAIAFCKWVLSQVERRGLFINNVERFPKGEEAGKLHQLRLPGRHHYREHFSRFFDYRQHCWRDMGYFCTWAESDFDFVLDEVASFKASKASKPAAKPTDYEPSEDLHNGDMFGHTLAGRIELAREKLKAQPGAVAGHGKADGYCFALAGKLVWRLCLPIETAVKLLLEWGERPDQVDENGNWFAWTEQQIRHKVLSAAKTCPEGQYGADLHGSPANQAERDAFFHRERQAREITTKAKPPEPVKAPEAKQIVAEAARPIINLLTLEDLANRPPPTWLVEKHFPTRGVSAVVGPSGVGKSFYIIDHALCIATGKPFLGKFPVERGSVVMVAGEGASGIGKRANAWKKHYGIEKVDNFYIVDHSVDMLNTRLGQAGVIELIDRLRSVDNLQLVIIDTLARCMRGDENTAKDMGTFIAHCDMLKERLRCAVILVHHTGKNGDIRGSNSLPGGLDSIWLIQEQGQNLTLTNVKQKDWEHSPAYHLQFSNLQTDLGDVPVLTTLGGVAAILADLGKGFEQLHICYCAFAAKPFSKRDAMSKIGVSSLGGFAKVLNKWKAHRLVESLPENKYHFCEERVKLLGI